MIQVNYDRYWRERLEAKYTPIRPRHRMIANYIKERGKLGDRVLDLGCGEGHILRLLEGCPVARWGCDVSSVPLRTIKDNGIYLTQCDLNKDWPYSGAFEFIIASELLEHLEQPGVVLGKVASRLSPNGVFLCTVPNVWNWQFLYPRLRGRRPNYDKTHLHFWTLPEFKRMLRHYGLVVMSSRPSINITPARLPRQARAVLPHLPFMKYLTGEQFLFVCRRARW